MSYSPRYVTDTEVLTYLGLEASGGEGTRARAEAVLFLELAEAQVDRFCGCSLAAASPDTAAERQFDSPQTRSLSLPPVRSITSVKLGFPSPTVLVVGGSLRQVWQYPDANDPVHGGVVRWLRLSSNAAWPAGRQNIWVTGKWGYSSTPAPVKQAVYRMVKRLSEARDRPDLVESESLAGGSVRYRDGVELLTQEEKDLLGPYAMGQLRA